MDPDELMTAIQIKRDAVKQNRIAIKEKNDALNPAVLFGSP
jgi:hypothetical protein